MATTFSARPDGGEQAISSVGTTWAEIRFPLRSRRITATFGSDGYLSRGETEGGAVSGHATISAGIPFEVYIGPPSYADLLLGYRPVQVAVGTGSAAVYVRSEVG